MSSLTGEDLHQTMNDMLIKLNGYALYHSVEFHYNVILGRSVKSSTLYQSYAISNTIQNGSVSHGTVNCGAL